MARPLTVNWVLPIRRARMFRRWDHTGNPADVWNYNQLSASVWNRALELLPYLERLGVRCLVNDAQERADVVAFVRSQDAAALRVATAAKKLGTRIVFDLCVNYFDVTGLRHDGSGATPERQSECLAMTALADAITTASPFIAGRAREHAPHARVHYFPDSIDRAHFRERKAYPARWDRPPIAIWCGYSVKAWCLVDIAPQLARHGMPLAVIADRKPEVWPKLTRVLREVEYFKWDHTTLPRHLIRGDVCVSPRDLTGDFSSYDSGHSCFKIGIFLAQGIPALASRVPSYSEVLHPEKTGLFCDSPEDWDGALERIAREPRALAGWGEAAADVMRPHWTENVAVDYAKLFRELVDG